MKRSLCALAAVLWIATVAAGGWLFVKSWTTEGSDGRMEIYLAPSERDQILAEMRAPRFCADALSRAAQEDVLQATSPVGASRPAY